VTVLVWVSLAVFLVAIAAGAIVASRRGLSTYRVARSFQHTLEPELATLLAGTEAMQAKVETSSTAPERLRHAAAELQQSIAILQRMVDATSDVQAAVRLLRRFRP
jgi:hypothetical protein